MSCCGNLFSDIGDAIQEGLDSARDKIEKNTQNLIDATETNFNNLGDSVQDGLDSLGDRFEGLGDDIGSAGQSVIDNVRDGVNDLTMSVAGGIGGLGGAILRPIAFVVVGGILAIIVVVRLLRRP